MADWGAGYANAASGLASIFMGKAQQNVRGREQAAEQARMLKEQKRQEMQELRKIGFQKEMAEADRQFRLQTMDKEYKQQKSLRAEDAAREMSDPYRQQMITESQARVNQMNQPAPVSSGSGLSQQSRAVNTQVNTIRSEFKGKPVEEAYRAAAAKYGTELAQAAFPGVTEAASNVARGLGLFDSASDRAKSYLNF